MTYMVLITDNNQFLQGKCGKMIDGIETYEELSFESVGSAEKYIEDHIEELYPATYHIIKVCSVIDVSTTMKKTLTKLSGED